jgi:hypothetical protein
VAGGLREAYETEESFLENLGMFLGIVSHHVADLCTPVHVGHKMDYRRVGVTSASKFHRRFERNMGRFARKIRLVPNRPRRVSLDIDYFWGIARATYTDLFLRLEELYAGKDKDIEGIREVTSEALTSAVCHTADIWHTILIESDMCSRRWSSESFV